MTSLLYKKAIVLHCRPFRETSLIVDVFSEEAGRVAFLAKGARTQNKRQLRASLQVGALIEIELRGRGDLKTLSRLESLQIPISTDSESFVLAFYLSELTLRLTQPNDPHPGLFEALYNAFQSLSEPPLRQVSLRLYEFRLIQELGIALDFEQDLSQQPIQPNNYYWLEKLEGFRLANESGFQRFSGESLIKIAQGEWQSESVLGVLKSLNRSILAEHLGTKPLKSRELWLQWSKHDKSLAKNESKNG